MRRQIATLPCVPPSVNNLFVTVRTARGTRRVKSSDYNKWLAEATIRLSIALKPVESYPVAIEITVFGGKDFPQSRDIANIEKSVGDALVAAQVIEDDKIKFVWESTQRYRPLPDKTNPSFTQIVIHEGIRAQSQEVAA